MTGAALCWAILAAICLGSGAWLATSGVTLPALLLLVLFARCVAELLWIWDARADDRFGDWR